jgi:nitrous oxidase accessory protein NosD
MKTHRFAVKMVGVAMLVIGMPCLFWHCDRSASIVGKYQAVDTGQADRPAATLELQANGKGIWSIETDNAAFRWNLHRKTLRLHTPAGGVVEGAIDGERIRIDMPGAGVIVFERLK